VGSGVRHGQPLVDPGRFVYSLVRPGPFESSGRRGAGLRRWYWVLLEPITQYNQ